MSLYKQLLIGICLFTVIIFCGSFYMTLESSREQYHNQLSAHAQDSATALGLSLTANIDDPVMTELMVNSIFDSGYFYRIRVVDIKTGNLLIERQNTSQSASVPNWFMHMVRLNPGQGKAVVMRGWTQAARIEVISHPMFALARLWGSLIDNFVLLSACSSICVLGVMFMLRFSLRPLNRIVNQAKAISRREYLNLPDRPKTPELLRVVEATNMMVSQLKVLFNEQATRTELLRQEAYNDSQTGLNNRRAFNIHLKSRLRNEENTSGLLLLLRVKDLIGLNQRHGAVKADLMLTAVADILKKLQQNFFPKEGFLARLRGAEFAIVAPPTLPEEMTHLISSLTTQLKALHDIGLSDATPVAHFSIVSFNSDDTPQALLSQADQALAIAEMEMSFFSNTQAPLVIEDSDNHHNWNKRLEAVLTEESFELFSQPVYGCKNKHKVLHKKILARIKTPEGQLIPAGRFMPWIYRLALSRRMDIVMLKQTLKVMAKNPQPLALSISGESVADEESINAFLQPLKNTRYPRGLLTLELDENELPNSDLVGLLVQKLNKLGCRLGIQHFGGRFHMIGNLPQWGLAWIKVDGGYIHGIDREEDKKLFIDAIYWATHQINLPLIAECVETEGELAVLKEIGLHGAMGRYFGDISTPTK